MAELWRLTRNRYGRAVYDFLAERGLKAARMAEYARECDGVAVRELPEGVAVESRSPAECDPATFEAFGELAGDDRALVATEGGEVVGYVFVSDRPVYVAPLSRTVDFAGAYVWRLFVAPAHRNRGIATALVSRAVAAAGESGAASAHALVAVDNAPSKWVFEANGFAVRRTLSYYRAFGFERRSATSREGRLGGGRSG